MNKRKFLPRWVGRFEVLERLSGTSNNYRLKLSTTMSRLHPVFHVEKLKNDMESSKKITGGTVIETLVVILDDKVEDNIKHVSHWNSLLRTLRSKQK